IFPKRMDLQEYKNHVKACSSYPVCRSIILFFFEQKLIVKGFTSFHGDYIDWRVTFKDRKTYLKWYELMGQYSYLHELKAKGFRYELIIT
ncbi:MAG: hypothetical protein OXJ52_07560, partial [Oligoflexia bacterium]|nr:hypothetical protein [Oligoflexia bacterium]